MIQMTKALALAIAASAVGVIGGEAMGAPGPSEVIRRVGKPGAIAYLQDFADRGGDDLYTPEQARAAARFLWVGA